MLYTHYYVQQFGFGFSLCVFHDTPNCMTHKIDDEYKASPSRRISREDAAKILMSWKKTGIRIRRKKVR